MAMAVRTPVHKLGRTANALADRKALVWGSTALITTMRGRGRWPAAIANLVHR